MRLAEVVESSLDESEDLPEVVDMTTAAFKQYFDSWLLYIGTGKKFLPQPGGLDDQNNVQMQTILELDSYFMKMLAQAKKDQQGDEDAL